MPVDLVTASASGLDPHISVAAALYQAARVAKARGLSVLQVQEMIGKHSEGRHCSACSVSTRVNVLQLNLALDAARR